MKVRIPTPLRSYTDKQSVVDVQGGTVAEVLEKINARHPGFRFRIINEQDRIREHIKIFVNEDQILELEARVQPGDTLHIICALSGGL